MFSVALAKMARTFFDKMVSASDESEYNRYASRYNEYLDRIMKLSDCSRQVAVQKVRMAG
jgi:hypothetical protein